MTCSSGGKIGVVVGDHGHLMNFEMHRQALRSEFPEIEVFSPTFDRALLYRAGAKRTFQTFKLQPRALSLLCGMSWWHGLREIPLTAIQAKAIVRRRVFGLLRLSSAPNLLTTSCDFSQLGEERTSVDVLRAFGISGKPPVGHEAGEG